MTMMTSFKLLRLIWALSNTNWRKWSPRDSLNQRPCELPAGNQVTNTHRFWIRLVIQRPGRRFQKKTCVLKDLVNMPRKGSSWMAWYRGDVASDQPKNSSWLIIITFNEALDLKKVKNTSTISLIMIINKGLGLPKTSTKGSYHKTQRIKHMSRGLKSTWNNSKDKKESYTKNRISGRDCLRRRSESYKLAVNWALKALALAKMNPPSEAGKLHKGRSELLRHRVPWAREQSARQYITQTIASNQFPTSTACSHLILIIITSLAGSAHEPSQLALLKIPKYKTQCHRQGTSRRCRYTVQIIQ